MYPFDFSTSMVKNRWYIAAFSDEISRDPIERTILGKPVAMYRKQDGSPVAMYGLCPHRYFPLAEGKVQGDSLACGYHGFVFDDDGKCSLVPSQGTGTSFCQPTYQIEERGPFCWIWMGDAEKADTDLIPPYEEFGLGEEGWIHSSENYLHLEGRSQLLIDNLMDLTHLPYVHHHLGGTDGMKNPKMVEENREKSFRVTRYGKVPWGDFLGLIYGKDCAYEGLADFEVVSDFYGPEFIRTGLPIFKKVEGYDEVPAGLGILYILHGITPETETTTHYYGLSTRNFRPDSEELNELQRVSDIKIRNQDKEAIDAVEQRLEYGAANQKELLVVADRPAVKVREIVRSLLEAEQS